MTQTLFLVPARGGSKGVPRKNLRLLAGIPLVGWAARNALLAAREIGNGAHRVVCSTDDEEIAATARLWGAEVPFERPAQLATDSAASIDVVVHALDWFAERGERFSCLALIQPTSPLALPADLAAAVRLFFSSGGDSVATVSPSHPPSWSYRFEGGRLVAPAPGEPAEARQDLGEWVALNGAAFVGDPERLRRVRQFVEPQRTVASLMPAERGIDVDTEAELDLCRAALASRPCAAFSIAGRAIGGSSRCFIIAEAGVNHDGDPKTAHVLIDAAADAGADAVKFQTWITERVCRPGAPKAGYQETASPGDVDQFAMLKRLELSRETHASLKRHAEERKLLFLSTPDEIDSARFLCELGVPALKVGSAELTNRPFLRELARLDRPLLLSTGMSSVLEIARALDAVRETAPVPVALLHCVSAYPAPDEEMNLRCIDTLRQAFGVPVGLSDHSMGTAAAMLGVPHRMAILEKHLTLDRSRAGPDHAASADPTQFAELVHGVRRAESMLGDGVKALTRSEESTLAAVRRTLVYAEDLPAGQVLDPGNLQALRTGEHGLSADAAKALEGRVLRRAVRSGAIVSEDDVQ